MIMGDILLYIFITLKRTYTFLRKALFESLTDPLYMYVNFLQRGLLVIFVKAPLWLSALHLLRVNSRSFYTSVEDAAIKETLKKIDTSSRILGDKTAKCILDCNILLEQSVEATNHFRVL